MISLFRYVTIIVGLLLVSYVLADEGNNYKAGPGCSSSINISQISGSGRFIVVDGVNRPAADYQVRVQNTAGCVVYSADVLITVPSGGFIYTTNNLNPTGQEGAYELVVNSNGFQGIAPGSTYTNASFTAYFLSSGVALGFDASIVGKCESTCITPTGTSNGCRAQTSVTLRTGSEGFNSVSGKYYGVYDVLMINIGGCGIYEVGLDFSLPPGIEINQTTGLVKTYGVGQYKATNFTNNQGIMQGDTLPIENRYTASLVAEFSSSPVIQQFTVDSTSFCAISCSRDLSTPAPSGQCSAIVTASFIPGTTRVEEIDGVNRIAADYEVFAANYGKCPVTSITFSFNPYSGSYVTNPTNLQSTGQTNQYTLTTELATPGSSYASARITAIFASSGFSREVPISAVVPQCSGACSSSSAPTTSAPTTSVETCATTASIALRATWISGSTQNRLYDFTITNTGQSSAQTSDIKLAFSTESTVTQSWNVQKLSTTEYRATLFSVTPGASARSSGFILTIEDSVFSSGFTDPTVTVTSTQC